MRILLLLILYFSTSSMVFSKSCDGDISGSWVDFDFHKTLIQTRSPIAASFASSVNKYVEIINSESDNEGCLKNVMVTDFHQTLASPTGFQLLDSSTIILKILGKNYLFKKIPTTLSQYINENSINGVYRDKQGNIFEFNSNGKLTINNNLVGHYAIYPDLCFNHYLIDCFNLTVEKGSIGLLKKTNLYFDDPDAKWLTYSFNITKNSMTIFKANIRGEDFIEPNKDAPLATLELVYRKTAMVDSDNCSESSASSNPSIGTD